MKTESIMKNELTSFQKSFMWLLFSASLLIAVLLAGEGYALWQMGNSVDGGGIGVHFLFFEINDHVAGENIPMYAVSFFSASLLLFLLSFLPFSKKAQRYISQVF